MSTQPVKPADTVNSLERLGDEALAAGKMSEALQRYDEANKVILAGVVDKDVETSTKLADALIRIATKANDVRRELQPPPKSPAERAAELRAAADAAAETGNLSQASHMSFRLGETLEKLGDRQGAESAYREAVVLARQVDAADPELMLAAFCSLINFLAPSEESIALAAEMAGNLVDRDEMYHPMRAAEAAYHWAVAELKFAEVTPSRTDHVIDGIVRQAIEMLDDICFHGKSQALQRQVAAVLRTVGRGSEADQWQTEADKYEDWKWFMDQEIPGHVHLWDIRIDLSDQSGADEW